MKHFYPLGSCGYVLIPTRLCQTVFIGRITISEHLRVKSLYLHGLAQITILKHFWVNPHTYSPLLAIPNQTYTHSSFQKAPMRRNNNTVAFCGRTLIPSRQEWLRAYTHLIHSEGLYRQKNNSKAFQGKALIVTRPEWLNAYNHPTV